MLDLLLPSPAALSEQTVPLLLLASEEEEEKEQVKENKQEGKTIMQAV